MVDPELLRSQAPPVTDFFHPMASHQQPRLTIDDFLSESERASDTYHLLTGAGALRSFLMTAVSILGDLCDEVMGPDALIEGRFASYQAFCEWVRDSEISESLTGMWRYYWDMAADLFALYGKLPRMSDWELHEEIILPVMEDRKLSDTEAKHLVRDRIIESCFAHARWIHGNFR